MSLDNYFSIMPPTKSKKKTASDVHTSGVGEHAGAEPKKLMLAR